jgi:hypothetical protein
MGQCVDHQARPAFSGQRLRSFGCCGRFLRTDFRRPGAEFNRPIRLRHSNGRHHNRRHTSLLHVELVGHLWSQVHDTPGAIRSAILHLNGCRPAVAQVRHFRSCAQWKGLTGSDIRVRI